MDPRVEEHARIIVEHSIDVQPGDEILIDAPPEAQDLLVALNDRLGAKGAFPIPMTLKGGVDRAQRAFLRAMDPEDYETPPETLVNAVKAADAVIGVKAASNTHETGDVDPEKLTRFRELKQPINEEFMHKRGSRWVVTQHPAPGNAQDAEMSTEAYADFVYEAVNKDWEAQREFQANMVDILDEGSNLRIVSGDTTNLRMSIDGMIGGNDFAENNLPGGEAYTAPVPDSVEGEVLFDKPVIAQGREMQDVRLVFEDGVVVEHEAATNEEMLTAILNTDDGARRLGELGIGMNRDIDRFTGNTLFDEKMGETVHVALGSAVPECVGPNREENESAIHLDMIIETSDDAYIEVDGDVVQRDGVFVFEEGFPS